MFSADLSWADPNTEKVGERRERKAKEKGRPESSAAASSKSSSSSLRTSTPVNRELWWTSGLKKAKALKPIKLARPDTGRRSTTPSRKVSLTPSQMLEPETLGGVKDPSLQPSWTYSTCLSRSLPSGASLDPPENEVPELEGDLSSRGTNSDGSRSSSKYISRGHCDIRRLTRLADDRHEELMMERKSPGSVRVIDPVHEVQQLCPGSFIERTTSMSSELVEDEKEPSTPSPFEKRKKRCVTRSTHCVPSDRGQKAILR